MVLYHGSEYVIEYPQPWLGRKQNDFGQGFYCTRSENIAAEWAVLHNSDGFVNSYQFDTSGLKILDLLNGEYHILNWLALLLSNRNFRIESDFAEQAKEYILEHFSITYSDADAIIGYRADDSYFAMATAFLNNALSLSRFDRAMKLGNQGEQVFINSRSAFSQLEYSGVMPASSEKYYRIRLKRDFEARTVLRDTRSSFQNETMIADIVRENWGNNDVRLRRIVRY